MVDPKEPHRFEWVRVPRTPLREAIIAASKPRVKDPGSRLLNTMIDLVFTKEELASSTGLGLKGANKSRCLDKEKVAAIKGTKKV